MTANPVTVKPDKAPVRERVLTDEELRRRALRRDEIERTLVAIHPCAGTDRCAQR